MSQFPPRKILNYFQSMWSQLESKSLTYQRAVHCFLWSPSIHLHPSSDLERDACPAITRSISFHHSIHWFCWERHRSSNKIPSSIDPISFFVISIFHIIYRPFINSSIIIHIIFIILVILFVSVSFIKIHKKTHKNLHFCFGYKSASKSPFRPFAHTVLLSDPESQSIQQDWPDPCLQHFGFRAEAGSFSYLFPLVAFFPLCIILKKNAYLGFCSFVFIITFKLKIQKKNNC